MDNDIAIIERAEKLLIAARWGKLSDATVSEYRRIAERTELLRLSAGLFWCGVSHLPGAPSTKASRRAAWSRYAHMQVASALVDHSQRMCTEEDMLERLYTWVPEAESVPPCPDHAVQPSAQSRRPPHPGKRDGLKTLPADWLDRLWHAASDRGYRHLGALSVLLLTGARPAEVCRGVRVRADGGVVEIAIAGAKVTADQGQPWRRLMISSEGHAAAHLAKLSAGNWVTIRQDVSPAALSMGIADLGDAAGLARRVSAYDVRHQRAADARTAFNGDMDMLAAWLGHSATSTARHYGRLPRSAGCRGARPLSAAAPREVRHRHGLKAAPSCETPASA